jgi:hypothetical protein
VWPGSVGFWRYMTVTKCFGEGSGDTWQLPSALARCFGRGSPFDGWFSQVTEGLLWKKVQASGLEGLIQVAPGPLCLRLWGRPVGGVLLGNGDETGSQQWESLGGKTHRKPFRHFQLSWSVNSMVLESIQLR